MSATSRRSSSNLSITYSSPRTSSSSFFSSRPSSGWDSASSSRQSSTMRSSDRPPRPVEERRRVADPSTAKADTITCTRRGSVFVINHDQRREDRAEPRSSDARSDEYNKSDTRRPPK